MPTKIISGASDPQNALISQTDVKAITDAYLNDCVLTSSSTGKQIGKTVSVSVPLSAMQGLIDNAVSQSKITNALIDNLSIKIKFGITLPNQKDCETGTTDLSNLLTVVLMINDNTNNASADNDIVATTRGLDNFVLTSGFRAFAKPTVGNFDPLVANACCPTQPPGGG